MCLWSTGREEEPSWVEGERQGAGGLMLDVLVMVSLVSFLSFISVESSPVSAAC